jgi:hypothetical protein
MIARALIVAACFASQGALAAQSEKRSPAPQSLAEFEKLPALGTFVEGGMEKDYRFRTYFVGKRPTSRGEITIFVGEVHMRAQDISGGAQRQPFVLKWTYAARCTGPANTLGVNTQSIQPKEKSQTYISVTPGVEPGTADRTWYNVWYAVCLDEFNRYPRNQDE